MADDDESKENQIDRKKGRGRREIEVVWFGVRLSLIDIASLPICSSSGARETINPKWGVFNGEGD